VVLSSAVVGDFEVFRPAEATCYTDGGNIKIAYRIVSCRMVRGTIGTVQPSTRENSLAVVQNSVKTWQTKPK